MSQKILRGRKGGREGGREGRREGGWRKERGREGGREGGKKRGRREEGKREGGREGGREEERGVRVRKEGGGRRYELWKEILNTHAHAHVIICKLPEHVMYMYNVERLLYIHV